ncbi:MAG: hypothetical protein E7299_00185 [Lachnospiraceae bacterium]|nr:hypothetical protein [Lachnospiraceae bacterium]
MKTYRLRAWEYIVTIVMLYTAGTPVSSYYHKTMICGVFLLALFCITLKNGIKKSLLIVLVITAILMVFTQVINLDTNLFTLISILMLFVAAILFVNTIHEKDFIEALINVMIIISVISIVMYFIGIIRPDFARRLPVFHGLVPYNTFCGLFFFPTGIEISDSVLRRNQGIYREMGVFANNIVWVLALGLKQEKKMELYKIIILVIALCTTFSTSGIISFICLLPLLIEQISKKRTAKRYIIYIISMMSGAFFLLRYSDIIFSKLFKSSGDYGSFAIRFNGTIRDIYIFLNNLWGAGITNYEETTVGTANTITYVLAVYGMGLAVLVFWGFFSCFWNRGKSIGNNLCREIAVFVVLLTQNSFAFPLFFVLVMYGYVKRCVKETGIMERGCVMDESSNCKLGKQNLQHG